MSRENKPPYLLLALLLLAYVLLAAWYSLVIPLGEAPDEVDHYAVIRYMGQHRQLLTSEEYHEAVQPPLYYFTGTALTFWIPDHAPFATLANADSDLSDPLAPRNLLIHPVTEAWPFQGWALAWHLVRLLSVLLGAITVWAIFHFGREIFPNRPEIALGMAALTAFTPQFLFMTAVVSNDNAVTAMSTLVLWQVAALLRRNTFKAPQSALLGLLLGLALLSKSNAIALVPVVGLAILVVWWKQQPRKLKGLLVTGAITFGLAALIAGWYYVRNWIVFGDPLGFSFVMAVHPVRQEGLSPGVLLWLFKGLSRSFWLGWIGIEFDEWIYWAIYILCLAGLVGFVSWLVLRWRRIPVHVHWMMALLGIHLTVTFASLIQWTAMVGGTDQGRLIFPLMPTVMLVLVGGLLIWLPSRVRAWAAGSLTAAWLVLALITPGRYLAPVHAGPPTLSSLPGQAESLDVQFGESIHLVGYHLDRTEVQPGERLSLHLYWQASAPLQADIWSLIELVDDSGAFLMYKDGSPSAGRDTTDRWQPGMIVASEHRLLVPEHGQPGAYRLTIRLHPSGERAWLPITGPDASSLGDTYTFDTPIEIVVP